MREDKKDEKIVNRKWISIVGFIISIGLLLTAIVLSANEEKISRETRINRNEISPSVSEQASSEITRTLNEIKNEIIGDNSVNEEQVNEVNKENDENQENNENKSETNEVAEVSNNENKEDLTSQTIGNSLSEELTNEQFIKPVDGEQITNYSMESLIYSNTLQEWMTHRGVDIKVDKTTVVKASAGGTIKSIKEDPRYGLSITIEHENGFQTVYSSLLSSEFVKEGDKVEQGQSIGTVGNSAVFESADGSHLHFEMLKDGEYVNPDIYIK